MTRRVCKRVDMFGDTVMREIFGYLQPPSIVLRDSYPKMGCTLYVWTNRPQHWDKHFEDSECMESIVKNLQETKDNHGFLSPDDIKAAQDQMYYHLFNRPIPSENDTTVRIEDVLDFESMQVLKTMREPQMIENPDDFDGGRDDVDTLV
mmetsp:Transcript_11981/g.19048  ORF Transcript_11981/g.19048 Transcript_11981/m.19048 type:complete len:149 (-) Transcript_11981:92-538(-)